MTGIPWIVSIVPLLLAHSIFVSTLDLLLPIPGMEFHMLLAASLRRVSGLEVLYDHLYPFFGPRVPFLPNTRFSDLCPRPRPCR